MSAAGESGQLEGGVDQLLAAPGKPLAALVTVTVLPVTALLPAITAPTAAVRALGKFGSVAMELKTRCRT